MVQKRNLYAPIVKDGAIAAVQRMEKTEAVGYKLQAIGLVP